MNNRVSPDSLNTRELGGYERGGEVGGLDWTGLGQHIFSMVIQ